MATLTETAYYTRRTINWTILGIIIYFLLRIFWFIIIAILLWLFPPKPPPPNHALGIMPKIKFSSDATPSVSLKFQLETIEGKVPVASSAGTVYFMPKKAANLLALTKTQNFANQNGFDSEPYQEKKNIYVFKDSSEPLRNLRYDIVTDNFLIRYLWEMNYSVLDEKKFQPEKQVLTYLVNLLNNNNLMALDIEHGYQKISYLRVVNNQFQKADSADSADAMRIDFFRGDINNLKVYTRNPNEGNVAFILSGSENAKKRILIYQYTYWPIEYITSGTYELKTSQEAWEELQNGKGFIAQYPTQGSTATVRKVTLGYYDSFEPQNFLQPIFIFEGDYNFIAYVQAISPSWTE
jgi:hypothetical protein